MDKVEDLTQEVGQMKRLCVTLMDRIRDLEQLADSLRVRMADIDQIPKMQKELDTLEVKIKKLSEKGDGG